MKCFGLLIVLFGGEKKGRKKRLGGRSRKKVLRENAQLAE
jgi:hypothetical protein